MVGKINNWIEKQKAEGVTYIKLTDILNLYPKDIREMLIRVFYNLNEFDLCFSNELARNVSRDIPYSVFLKTETKVSNIAIEFKAITGKYVFYSYGFDENVEHLCFVLHSLIEECFILKTKPFFNISYKIFIKENLEEEFQINLFADEERCFSYEGTFSDARITNFREKIVNNKIKTISDVKEFRTNLLYRREGLIGGLTKFVNKFILKNFEKIFFIDEDNYVEEFDKKCFDERKGEESLLDFIKYEFLHYGKISFETHRKFLQDFKNMNNLIQESFLNLYKENIHND